MPHPQGTPRRDRRGLEGVACDHCSARAGCLAGGLEADDRAALDAIAERGRPLNRGETAYAQGDPFRALYLVRSGFLKTFSRHGGEEPRIHEFYVPGDLVGLDAITAGRHEESAEALDTTSLCALPYPALCRLAGSRPEVRRALLRAMSQGLRRGETWHRLLGTRSAVRRLAGFLEDLGSRFPRAGPACDHAALPIPKQDLANYLGLAPETVSRGLARLERHGMVRLTKRSLRIHNFDALRRLVRVGGQV